MSVSFNFNNVVKQGDGLSAVLFNIAPVSYTHLDVYKRQILTKVKNGYYWKYLCQMHVLPLSNVHVWNNCFKIEQMQNIKYLYVQIGKKY